MTLDGQVLLIAFLAMSLELIVWGIEPDDQPPPHARMRPANSNGPGSALDSKVD
jgi:hypothetical protein